MRVSYAPKYLYPFIYMQEVRVGIFIKNKVNCIACTREMILFLDHDQRGNATILATGNKRSKRVWGFFLCALVTSDDGDDVIVLGMPQQRGHMLAIFSPLYLSQWNRGELGGFDSTLHLSHAYKHPSPHPPPLTSVTS